MKALLTTALTGTLLLTLGATHHPALALYDGSLNSHPDSQGWTYFPRNPLASPATAFASRTLVSGGTRLDTISDDRIQSGYSYGPPFGATGLSLNRATGYNLRFDLQVLAEDHSNANADNNLDGIADRAGVSIIALSSDGEGIELGFWTDRVWAQEDGSVKADPVTNPTGTRFTQAERSSFATTALNQYDLSIVGTTYYLFAGGNYATPLLTGRLRNYSLEGTPYNRSSFVYIGDNTTSARGAFQLNQVTLSNSAIVPVPFAFNPLFGVGLFALSRLRKAKQSAN